MAETCSYGCGCCASPQPIPAASLYGSGHKYGGGCFRPRRGIMSPLRPKTKTVKAKKARKARKVRRHAKRAL